MAQDPGADATPRRSRRWRSTLVLVALAVGVGVYEVGWGDDPQWGWVLAVVAVAILAVQLVWRPRLPFAAKAALTVAVILGVLVLVTDPFLAVARGRALAHRAELEAVGEQTVRSPTSGVFAGTRAPTAAATRLAGTDARAAVPDVPRLAGEPVLYGAVVAGSAPRASFCLDERCDTVLAYAPRGDPPTPTSCDGGRTVAVDALVDGWFRVLAVDC